MALKDILVHLDTGARSSARLSTAVTLARRHGAHLTGLYVVDIPESAFFYGGSLPYAGVGPDLVAQTRAERLEAGQAVEKNFREALRREGLQGEWRIGEGDTGPVVALHARYADLTVAGQPGPEGDPRAEDIITTPLMTAGRPVLAVPYAGEFQAVGDRVLVAWNASREATRAVHDAMPLLEMAKHVMVLAVNPRHGIQGHGDVPAADLALHLARHGVRAEAAHTVANDIPDGEALLSYAADVSADLIVAGGYGHSRAREMVFGGVTRTLMREMTVPVLFSH
ncbi:MAG: universal stress protein [Acetobacteraceae bacterium]